MLPEYQQKVEVSIIINQSITNIVVLQLQVLKYYKFIDKNGTIQLKGRVACEIHTHEVMVTELLFRNSLADFEPPEIAALLSCMIFQQVRNEVNNHYCV